jgi:hypothetical protein
LSRTGLQALSWVSIRVRPAPSYSDPKGSLPELDTTEAGGLIFKSDAGVGFPKVRFFTPDKHEIEWFVEWSDEDAAIAEASNLLSRQRALLYESWYSVDPRYFLVMQRKETIGAIWETVALSIILALPEKTLARIKSKNMSVVDLRAEHLRFQAGERVGRYLLYDTLIFEPHFREIYSEFKRWHSLMHFARFDPPEPGTEVTILIEPDNPRLKKSLQSRRKYGKHPTFKIIGNHVVHEFHLPRRETDPARVARFEFYWKLLRSKKWVIPVGRN